MTFSEESFRDAFLGRLARTSARVDDEQLQQLARYYSLLRRWNRAINLTALPVDGYDDRALDRLLIEPVVAAAAVSSDRIHWSDLGSGGGSPAIPLKIMRPAATLTMVESRSRKVAFLREVARELTLQQVIARDERIEALGERDEVAGSMDLVTVRAVRPEVQLFDVCHRLLRAEGRLLMFQSVEGGADSRGDISTFDLIEIIPLIPGGSSTLAIYRPR